MNMRVQEAGSQTAIFFKPHELKRLHAVIWAGRYAEEKDLGNIGEVNFVSCRRDLINLLGGAPR